MNLMTPDSNKSENISNEQYEHAMNIQTNQELVKSEKLPSHTLYQSLNSDFKQITLNNTITKMNDDVLIPMAHKFLNNQLDNEILSTTKQISTTIQSDQTYCSPE